MLISQEREEKYQHFKQLKLKYGISSTAYYVSSLNPLYPILQALEQHQRLTKKTFEWLYDKNLLTTEIRDVAQKIDPRHYKDLLMAKQASEQRMRQQRAYADKQRKKHQKFERLKSKYHVYECDDERLCTILEKLEQKKRLSGTEFIWLQEQHCLTEKIRVVYHSIEATHYEQEYARTSNLWNIVNASSSWRKARKSKNALRLTNTLKLSKIQPQKLKAALLTTRGGAFRDINQSAQAEICAKEAMGFQPENFRPYTLMGALCYDRRDYLAGDQWFRKALSRGATADEVDVEIKRIVKRAKGQELDQLIEHLLQIDSHRYGWTKKIKRSIKHKTKPSSNRNSKRGKKSRQPSHRKKNDTG